MDQAIDLEENESEGKSFTLRVIPQTREERDQTFVIPTTEAITEENRRAKLDAVEFRQLVE